MVVPETKGRDLDSIAKLFVKNSSDAQDATTNATGDKTNGLHTATTIELHVPVPIAILPAAHNETNHPQVNLEITKM